MGTSNFILEITKKVILVDKEFVYIRVFAFFKYLINNKYQTHINLSMI